MKPSRYISQIAKTNILKKGQRTWLSLVSILLSTAIIFTSLTLFVNVFSFSKNVDYQELGNYHYATMIHDEVVPSNRYSMTKDVNTHYYGILKNESFNLRQLQIEDEKTIIPFVITEGSLPTKSQEILLSDTLGYQIGDLIELTFGKIKKSPATDNLYQLSAIQQDDLNEDIQTSTFKVVGLYKTNEKFLKQTNQVHLFYVNMNAEDHSNQVYYIYDKQVHLSGAFDFFLERFNVQESSVITNMDVISNDSVNNYLKDTTIILVMFVAIAAIGIAMSLISVQNVLIISDKDRKKELGLLKSIGATPNEVKKLITIELIFLGVVGAFIGLVLGCGISYLVLNLFIDKLYITFKLSMILNPIIILVSFVGGVMLMYISGMKAYQKYFYSTAISDLKDFSYDYAEPVKAKNKRHRTFAWRMFTIYNGRMKKQTKNIFQSFTLLLFTCILFMSTFLSNAIYVNRYVEKGYDFDISNYVTSEGLSPAIAELSQQIYQKEKEGAFVTESLYAERIMVSAANFFLSYESEYEPDLIQAYESTARLEYVTDKDENGNVYGNLYHFTVAMDQMQFDELKPYVVEGSLDHLGDNDVVSILSKDDRMGYELCKNIHVGDQFGWDTWDNKKTVAAVVVLPSDAYEGMHFNYADYPRVMAYSMEALIEHGKGSEFREHIYIKLKNATAASSTLDVIDRVMYEVNAFDTYECNPVALTVETNRFATFIIEVLLYPLFLMLSIVSLMNLNNVFVGNVHLKRGDVSVMKSVGMTNFQLYMLFIFEYVEGYINAALVSIAVFVPLVFLERFLGIPSVYEFGSNIFGTLIIALFFLGIIMVAPLIVLSLKKITEILPIENLKNVD